MGYFFCDFAESVSLTYLHYLYYLFIFTFSLIYRNYNGDLRPRIKSSTYYRYVNTLINYYKRIKRKNNKESIHIKEEKDLYTYRTHLYSII